MSRKKSDDNSSKACAEDLIKRFGIPTQREVLGAMLELAFHHGRVDCAKTVASEAFPRAAGSDE